MSIRLGSFKTEADRQKAIADYENYLKRIFELAKKVNKGNTSEAPPELPTAGSVALYNNLGRDLDLSLEIHETILQERQDSWRNNTAKERMLKGAIHKILKDQEKVEKVLELVYINLANIKVETFDDMVSNTEDMFKGFLKQMMGSVPSFLDDDSDNKMEQLRKKFISGVIKYEKNPLKFFQVECEKFNYIATKMLKKIGKLYAMAKDDEQPVSESILNWELHQRIMEKKYGKRKIETEYKYKK
jgi:hypothetical protein